MQSERWVSHLSAAPEAFFRDKGLAQGLRGDIITLPTMAMKLATFPSWTLGPNRQSHTAQEDAPGDPALDSNTLMWEQMSTEPGRIYDINTLTLLRRLYYINILIRELFSPELRRLYYIKLGRWYYIITQMWVLSGAEPERLYYMNTLK